MPLYPFFPSSVVFSIVGFSLALPLQRFFSSITLLDPSTLLVIFPSEPLLARFFWFLLYLVFSFRYGFVPLYRLCGRPVILLSLMKPAPSSCIMAIFDSSPFSDAVELSRCAFS